MKYKVYNVITSISLTAAFIALAFFVFDTSYLRFAESAKDLWNSVRIYFCEIFGIRHSVEATVLNRSDVMSWNILLPADFESFTQKAKAYFSLLIDESNFKSWLVHSGRTTGDVAKALVIALPCTLVLFLIIKKLYSRGNTKHNEDTLPLRIFKKVSSATYQPLKRYIINYIGYLKETNVLLVLWVVIWCFNLNIASIIVEFFAYYFYFAVSYKIDTLYLQVCKLFIDLQVIFANFPWWIIGVFAWLIFDKIRKNIADSTLRYFEAKNCGFINEVPIVSISCGSMGKKKTTMITDMALSQEVMFRQKAYKILQDNDMKFPYFPWIAFEDELRRCMEYGTVYNLATVKEWIKKKRERFERHGNADLQLYGYDVEKYGIYYNDALRASDLFDVLKTYALAYFVYVTESSLIVSNYSVRVDNTLLDSGNFPAWTMDFFPEGITDGRHSHIIDFDALRLGKKLIENNPKAGSFEFGVVAISEIGKERGNNLELKEVKKGTDETNQKNDLFNSWLKMCRHSATIDNYPFIKVFTDEQRPESWGADARDLCDIIHIVDSSEQRLAMPFYTIEEMISEWIFNRFISLYYDFRFKRGDNTLLVYLLKTVTSWLWRRNIRLYNRFGYCSLHIEKERGTMNARCEKKKYYLMNKKIYSRRFSTDCFSDYFNDMAKKTNVGLSDYLEYASEKATVDELKMQNSYFINTLYKDAK